MGHYLNMGRVASKQSIDGGSNNNSRQQSTETLHKISGGGENGLPINQTAAHWTPPGKSLYRQHYAPPGPGLMQRSSTTVGFLEGYSKKYDIYGGVNGMRKQAADYGVVPPLRQSSVRQTMVNINGQGTPSRQSQSGILGFVASKVQNGGSSDYRNLQNMLKTKD